MIQYMVYSTLVAVMIDHNYMHSTKYIFIKSTTVYVPSSELGLSHPLSRRRVCPPPGTKGGGGGTLACV
jgi:hypothetical protein